MKRIYWIAFTIALSAFAQGDRGTITGTVTDSSAAAVANAKIEVKNVDTGELYSTASTETGNYTLAQLPAANYELRVSSAGFTEYVQQGIRVQVAQVERINVVVQIGSSTQAVTVTADAPLLRTENAAVTEDITGSQINALPLYGAQGANAGPRWAMSFAQTEPGTTLVASSNGLDTATRVNGLPNSSFQVRVEGMEATWIENPGSVLAALPGVDSLEEVALQTSNFSAEYGQVSGGMFNFTTKSGTNSLHGSGFEFFRNEFMNASQPFTNVRPYNRSQDFGGSVGGPVYLPHLYNGRNRTFFFFNDERYYQNLTVSGIYGTVPTTLMRAGNFSQILTGRQLATDPLGNPIMENTIYDPATASTVNGQIVTTPFAGNVIPQSRINPISTAIQSYVPLPTNSALVNNYAEVQPSNQRDNVLSVKVDHNLNDKTKMSFYFAYKTRGSDINVSMPTPITRHAGSH